MNNIIIYGGSILTMDQLNTVHTPGWVLVSGDRIVDLGKGQPPRKVITRATKMINATNKVVLPGLINGHTHLSQSFMRGLADGVGLPDWLKRIRPVQAAMTPQDMELASLLGLVENLRCGVTSVVQHHKITFSIEHVDASLKAARTVGLRILFARGWRDSGDNKETLEGLMREMTRLLECWHGSANGRIIIGFGPMVPWRCSETMMRQTLNMARAWGLPTHIHIAETREEVEASQQSCGLRHVEWLNTLGALGPDIQLVHCVWVDDTELEYIAHSKSIVVHCPVSNMYLASGIAPVRKMLDRQIVVTLGTDGSASNNSQDMLTTIKVAALLARIGTGSAAALMPDDVLRMATVNGAHLFSRHDLGYLAVGNKADIIIVDLNTTRSTPVYSLTSALVHTASGPDVHTVIVDGRVLLDAGRVTMVDETTLLTECREAASRLIERVGMKLTLVNSH